MSQVSQTSNGGDAVPAKTAAFQYDAACDLTGVGRYQNADATANLVAQATYGYDGDGNLTSGRHQGQKHAAKLFVDI